ncbi:Uncharacterised protein [Serratia fonticola]|uniref:RadC-like JAB domain-containing protein n=1 Tax=Serratia fonticola TaxID=47917 RepID=A0A4V6KWG7_SERFO|nr:Uncharacterised protein [Serratia fonticola]
MCFKELICLHFIYPRYSRQTSSALSGEPCACWRNISAQPGEQFTAASVAKSWVQLQLARQEREVFLVMYLDNQHCLLGHEALFTAPSAIPKYIPVSW